jgi:CMP-N,N'-diacetyllegionaminic acid synthase
MKKSLKILAVIPARKGSKGIPGKNMTKILGKPLIYFTIKNAKKSKYITSIIVSTDCKKIAKISKKMGAEVPFLRPDKLATDKTQTFPVIKHAIKQIEKIKYFKFDYIILLQPTCPLRSFKDIDVSLKRLILSNSNSITSIVDVGANHPLRMKIIKKNKLKNYIKQDFENMKPRQELSKVYIRNGAIYAFKRNVIFKEKALVSKNNLPYLMPKERSVNIDTQEDLILAKYYLKKNVS